MLSSLLQALTPARRQPRRPTPRGRHWRSRVVPRLEALEERLVLNTTFTVNTILDTPDANPGDGLAQDAAGRTSLRAAIDEGNASRDTAITITFGAQLGSGLISLASALPALDNNFTIAGPGATALTVGRGLQAFAPPPGGNFSTSGIFNTFGGPQPTTSSTPPPQFGIFTILLGRTCSIQGLTVTGGNNPMSGGAIDNAGNLTLIGCVLANNTAAVNGGAVFNDGVLTAAGCDVNHNHATGDGGGFYNADANAILNLISGCSVYSNSATNGGGIYLYSGTCSVRDSSQIGYNTAQNGAGIYIDGTFRSATFTMNGGSVSQNWSDGMGGAGGGVYVAGGSATFTGVSITQNSATGKGGGFYVLGGTIAFNASTISNNSAIFGAGGAYKSPGSYSADSLCFISDVIQEDV
jgi:large repetitive protein